MYSNNTNSKFTQNKSNSFMGNQRAFGFNGGLLMELFKTSFILLILFLLQSCGDDIDNFPQETIEVPGPVVETEIEKEILVEVNQNFEGLWICNTASVFDLLQDFEDKLYIEREGQVIRSVNPNSLNSNNVSIHPTFDSEQIPAERNGTYTYENTFRYSSSNNVREDSDNDLITGDRATRLTFKKVGDDEMTVRIQVFDRSNINDANKRQLVNRTLVCTR